MNHVFEYLEDKGIVLVKIAGTYDFDIETDVLKEIASKHKEHNSERSLWDFREAKIVGSILALYNRPKLYEHLNFIRHRKRAMVLKELNDDWQYFENVCVNRGWNIKLFIDYDAAINWLTE